MYLGESYYKVVDGYGDTSTVHGVGYVLDKENPCAGNYFMLLGSNINLIGALEAGWRQSTPPPHTLNC